MNYNIGDKKLCLDDANFLAELRLRFQSGEFQFEDPQPSIPLPEDSNILDAINLTGGPVTPGCIVGIGMLRNNEGEPYGPGGAFTRPFITAEEYEEDEHGCNVGIVTDGAKDGCDIKVQMCGVTVVNVDMSDEENDGDHCYANPQDNDAKCLKSTSNPKSCFEIVSRAATPDDDGKLICVVKFHPSPVGYVDVELFQVGGEQSDGTNAASWTYDGFIDLQSDPIFEGLDPTASDDGHCWIRPDPGFMTPATCGSFYCNKDGEFEARWINEQIGGEECKNEEEEDTNTPDGPGQGSGETSP